MSALSTPIEVFLSYATEDEVLCNELEKHLSVLQRQGVIAVWYDRRIVPGTDWSQEIDTHLSSSSIILLLISPDFLASDYRYGAEMQRALERQRNGEVYVIPVLLRAVDFQDAPFAHLPCLPRVSKAVASWSNQDEAFYDVARGIRQVVAYLRKVERISPLPLLPSWTITSPSRTDRERMLKRVRTLWIKGVLEQSLHRATLIALGLHEQPDAVANPWRLVMQEATQPARSLPAGTRITEVYNDADGEILILGEPGAGKTTLLLELTRDLLDRADQDPTHPIPVVFNLSSWAAKQQSIAAWLVEELNIKYQVPRKVGMAWTDTNQLLLLLDGLDEVAELQRSACIEAINAYRHEHAIPLVVCSRRAEYQAQAARIVLQSAVLIQPLSAQQIDDYLSSAGRQLETVREALHTDPELQEITQTPLMLSIVALAYQGKPAGNFQKEGPAETLQQRVFETYIQRMLQRREFQTRYTPEQTRRCMAWLACQMMEHNQSELYLERMQPDWLPIGWLRRLYPWTIRLTIALVSGILVSLILSLGILWFRLPPLLVTTAGFIGGFLLGLMSPISREINPAEVILWSLSNICRNLIRSTLLRAALVGGLMSGGIMTSSFSFFSIGDLYLRLSAGLLVGMLNGTISGFTVGAISKALNEYTLNESEKRPQRSRWLTRLGKIMFQLNVGIIVWLMSTLLFLGFVLVFVALFPPRVSPAQLALGGVFIGGFFGLIAGLSSMLVIRASQEMQTMRVAGWLWIHTWSRLIRIRWLSGWLAFALLVTLLIAGSALHTSLPFTLMQLIFLCILLTPLFSLVSGIIEEMISGLSSRTLEKDAHMRPNQGIWRSGRNSIRIGLIFGLVGGLLFGLASGLLGAAFNLQSISPSTVFFFALFLTFPGGIISGMSVALLYGGTAFLQHGVLRLLFRSTDATPKNYIHFLDYAYSRILLRKVGGGYTFVHRQFLEYFATLSEQIWRLAPKRGLRSQLLLLMISIIVITSAIGLVSYDMLSRYPNAARLQKVSSPEPVMNPSYLLGHETLSLSDPLSSSDAWSPRSNTDFGGDCRFVNGAYQISQLPPKKVYTCSEDNTYSNFAFEVKMRIKQGDCGGLEIRRNHGHVQSYLFEVCQDGEYNFYKYLSSKGESDAPSLTGGNTSAINQGEDQLNVIAVVASSSNFDLYINAQKIDMVSDSTYSQGILGLVASAKNNATVVTYQDAKVWAIPENANVYPSYLPGHGTLILSDPLSGPDAWGSFSDTHKH